MNFIIQLIVGVVLGLASTLLKQAFSRPQEQQKTATGTRGSTQLGGKVPQSFLIGTVGDAGKLEYRNSWGQSGEVPNAYETDVYSFGDLPLSALTGLYVNGTRMTLSTSGGVTQGYPVAEYNNGANHFWWRFFDGTQTSADSFLRNRFGTDADRPWLADMIGRGVPYLTTTALWSETLWTGFPTILGEFQGIKLYDPRKDSTAGGSGSQRWSDQSTWAFSDNSAVIIYNIERGIYFNGAHIWGGRATAAQMPYDVWSAAMDACDESVALASGGSEKRFRAGRKVSLNERPSDVITDFLIGCNGRISHASDGTIYILIGVPDTADGAFTDADVLATEPLGSIPFPNLDEIINGATATYREPSQAWEDKETAPYYRADLETEDDGRRQAEGLDLRTTFSGTQAQRVQKAVIEEGRRFRRHVVALPPEFAQYRPLQVLAWTSDRFGYVAKFFLVTARTRAPWGQVVLGLQEVDPADHGWTPGTDERPLSFAPVVTNRPPPQPVVGFSLAPVVEVDSNGNDRRAGYDAFWSAASVAVDVEFVRISHRLVGDTLPRWVGLIPLPNLLLGSGRVTDGTIPGTIHEVEIQYLAASGRETLSSGWLQVAVPSLPEAVDIQVSQLGEYLAGAVGFLTGNTPGTVQDQINELREQFGDLANAVITGDDTSRRRISTLFAQSGAATAGIIRNETAIVEEGRARAEAIDEVVASLGDILAQGFLKFEAEVDEEGAKAQITAKVKATFGSTFSQAAWALRAEADGDGGSIGQFGVVGSFYVFPDTESPGLPALSATSDGIRFESGQFRRLESIATADGSPIIVIDGDTGFFSFGVAT
ncbi:hypothetical protein GCM10011321_14560 [Youhaiella tibetensis]|uniref:Uncharacterized protein n=1 Tax=Paradevosia tibetensis TaxID=1447062 RepID=A0A5B9DNM8_9HYPH|nr:hypothetical protein [Youhaiella tibetensis]QEE20424.1 hypothetical protein FNA67_09670 [Youhaiella tibetensis]GGF24284.1 hypothetical protein GCM10011321_14560 [Youhaiella tibetensis]